MNTPMQTPDSPTKAAPADPPALNGKLRYYEEHISKLYTATSDILSNLQYICAELPDLKTAGVTRDAILKVCGDFEWEILDIRMEIRRLEDNLGLHPGEEPFQHGMESDDPTETMGSDLLMSCLGQRNHVEREWPRFLGACG